MKKLGFVVGIFAVCFAFCAATTLHAQDSTAAKPMGKMAMKTTKNAAKEESIEGEVVDMACYLGKGEKGADHMQCGSACASRGTPVGVLDSKNHVYTIIAASAPYADYVSKTVRVTGTVVDKNMVPKKVEVKDGDNWKEVKMDAAH
jgi:hypothetical protein